MPRILRAALLLLASALALAALPARAQEDAPLRVFLLPAAGDVVGDGATAYSWAVVALGPDGTPAAGLAFKATGVGGAGVVGDAAEAQPGVYRFTWTPPAVPRPTRFALSARAGDGKLSVQVAPEGRRAALLDRSPVVGAWTVPVAPPSTRRITVTANPDRIVLGTDPSATLTIEVPGAADVTEADIVVEASAGTVSNLTAMGDGRFTALYTPPQRAYPQLAIVTVADRRDPAHAYGWLVLPLVGRAQFPVSALPNSRVVVRVGDREFGPVQADASGRARVPIVVPPGVDVATVVSVAGDKRTEEPLDLQVPRTGRVRLFPTWRAAPADPSVPVTVRAFVARRDGRPDTEARVRFTASVGSIGEARHEGGGVYAATWSPPLGYRPATATVAVSVEGDPEGQGDAEEIALLPARPKGVELSAVPEVLPPEADSLRVLARVVGADDKGIPGRHLAVRAVGARIQGRVRDLGGGDYEARLSTTGRGPVDVIATVRGAASDNPLRHVVVLADRGRLSPDGLSSALLTVLTLDAFGYPVAGVPVQLQVVEGDGSLPPSIVTDETGMAQVTYTAGRTPGVVHLRATAEEHVGAVALLQLDAGTAPGLELPETGSQAQLDLVHAWRAILATLHVPREGFAEAAAPATAADLAGRAGPVARIEVAAEPARVASGGTVVLRVDARDAEGRGAAGRTFEWVASAGTLGAVQDLGGGRYQCSLTVPVGVAGEVKVTVLDPERGIAGFVRVPVEASSAWATTPAPASAGAEEPVAAPAAAGTAAATAAEVRGKRREAEAAEWALRVRAGVFAGGYTYAQEPLTSTGPLYGRSIRVDSPAGAGGLGLRARAWVPGLRLVGADIEARTARWSIELPTGFDEPIPDWVSHLRASLLGRVPFDVGDVRAHAGLRVGLAIDDFLVFKQESEGQVRYLAYENLVVSGFSGGIELGAERGDVFAHLASDVGIVDGWPPYSFAWEARLGWRALGPLFFEGFVGRRTRTSNVWSTAGAEKHKVGTLEDALFTVGAAAGWQM